MSYKKKTIISGRRAITGNHYYAQWSGWLKAKTVKAIAERLRLSSIEATHATYWTSNMVLEREKVFRL